MPTEGKPPSAVEDACAGGFVSNRERTPLLAQVVVIVDHHNDERAHECTTTDEPVEPRLATLPRLRMIDTAAGRAA